MAYDEDGEFYPEEKLVNVTAAELTIKITHDSDAFMSAVVREVASYYHKRVTKLLDKAIEDKVEALVDEAANARIADSVETILRDGFQPTNEYGNPKGERKTVQSLILETLTRGNNYSSRQNLPSILEGVLKKRFDAEIEAATKTIRGMVDGEIKERLNKALREALGQK